MEPKAVKPPSNHNRRDLHLGSGESLSQSQIKNELESREPNPLILALLGKSYDSLNEAPGVSSGLPVIDDEVRQRIAAQELANVSTSVEVIACLSRTALGHYKKDVRESALTSLAKHDQSLAAAVSYAATFSADSEFRESALSSLFEIDPCLGSKRAEVIKSSDADSSVLRFAAELLIDYSAGQSKGDNHNSKNSEAIGKLIAEILYNHSVTEAARIESIEHLVKTNNLVAAVILSSIEADSTSQIGQKVTDILKQNYPELFAMLSQ